METLAVSHSSTEISWKDDIVTTIKFGKIPPYDNLQREPNFKRLIRNFWVLSMLAKSLWLLEEYQERIGENKEQFEEAREENYVLINKTHCLYPEL